MAKSPQTQLRLTLILIEAIVGAACVALIIVGAMRATQTVGIACLAAGLVGVVVLGATLPLLIMLYRMHAGGGGGGASSKDAGAIHTSRSIENLLAQLYQNSMLSDIAKRVLFRDQELDLLRRAIEEDIAHSDYNAGLTLCDDMANVFGRREEAEAFRTRILQAGHAAYEAKVRQSLDQFDQILAARDWANAHREAASIKRLYPAHHLVQELDQRILQAREDHKKELEAHFIDAANRDDLDSAMTLLRELDKYLTREEAGRLAQTAQRVVSKHRDNLSMQFKLAVNDHRWAEAAQVGDIIMQQYPNTKMADEVRSMIDVLRVRASQAAVMAQS
jgi:hypothetical protein